jgi:hypothetical protein
VLNPDTLMTLLSFPQMALVRSLMVFKSDISRGDKSTPSCLIQLSLLKMSASYPGPIGIGIGISNIGARFECGSRRVKHVMEIADDVCANGVLRDG